MAIETAQDLLLSECLYYCVREDYNCMTDPEYRERDERIEQALVLLAQKPSPDGLAPIEIDAFCRAMQRRGRTSELAKIPWLKVEKEGCA